jgi:hypothetical protein
MERTFGHPEEFQETLAWASAAPMGFAHSKPILWGVRDQRPWYSCVLSGEHLVMATILLVVASLLR